MPDEFALVMPPVGSQGGQGSCVSWAVGYSVGSYYMNINDNSPYFDDKDLISPKYIYNQIRKGNDCGAGTTFPQNLSILRDQGACSLASMPYNDKECSLQPNNLQRQEAKFYKISSWNAFTRDAVTNKYNLDNIKKYLYAGKPILIGLDIGSEFDNLKAPYILKQKAVNPRGGHAITVTGWSNTRNAFKVLNQWGKGWADKGYLWIDYDAFHSIVNRAIAVEPIIIAKNSINLNNGLVLDLPFEGDSKDISGNNNDGIVNGATVVTGRSSNHKGYKFHGFNNPNFIRVPNSSSLKIDKSFTISTWVRIDNTTAMDYNGNLHEKQSYQCIFAKDFDGYCIQGGVTYDYNGGNNTFQAMVTGDWSTDDSGKTDISYELGKWMHLTYVNTGTELKFYKNGLLVISLPGKLSYTMTNTKDLYIGQYSSYWYPLDGVMDDFKMYNRALSDAEVQALYHL